ncbi:FadR family transcriptional regulator [Rhodococcus sp. RS1C4]|uniref:FadR/GntR family transcriptional regulator n=1 Tax=Nocardiaceae TaxID=85025 RepID=UPI000362BAD0|nr:MULTISPECIES: FCD domain-containing protein [Rhodococcus]OZC46940.1 FadR family transcriptional regulator [Rhodococcus sp. 06-621-2]OZC53094.1 FadR family transcriptional regulator [Rhodococcus sp. RS1C4]OZC79244.1 FadR family transcriptional regulator [Rhodococcus sp. 06-418-1B]OZD15041.1 FadR family transcriptional regulator [Rhodococcus sp. 06-156-4C]OZD19874.1 FadR family transcriptional regulator [Rhodococcus sp. 06-156-4a]
MVAESLQLHVTVLEKLGRDIVDGTIVPGTRISADDVAARFEVSRTVVREVVRVLESLGLLTVRRKVGITVQESTAWNALDPLVIRWQLAGPDRAKQLIVLSELRSGIEPLAARLAADRATPQQCGQLTAAVIGMSATSRAANSDAYLAHDSDFHRTLLAASGNPMLRSMSEIVVEVLAGRTRHALMPHQADPEAIRLHGVVASSIQAGDAAAAEQAMLEIVTESAAAMSATARGE